MWEIIFLSTIFCAMWAIIIIIIINSVVVVTIIIPSHDKYFFADMTILNMERPMLQLRSNLIANMEMTRREKKKNHSF